MIIGFFSLFVFLSYLIKNVSNNRVLLKGYYLAMGFGFGIFLHGPKFVILIAILLFNFCITVYIKHSLMATFIVYFQNNKDGLIAAL
jgi:hypothetical protein